MAADDTIILLFSELRPSVVHGGLVSMGDSSVLCLRILCDTDGHLFFSERELRDSISVDIDMESINSMPSWQKRPTLGAPSGGEE
jgi:hypothetical protein